MVTHHSAMVIPPLANGRAKEDGIAADALDAADVLAAAEAADVPADAVAAADVLAATDAADPTADVMVGVDEIEPLPEEIKFLPSEGVGDAIEPTFLIESIVANV